MKLYLVHWSLCSPKPAGDSVGQNWLYMSAKPTHPHTLGQQEPMLAGWLAGWTDGRMDTSSQAFHVNSSQNNWLHPCDAQSHTHTSTPAPHQHRLHLLNSAVTRGGRKEAAVRRTPPFLSPPHSALFQFALPSLVHFIKSKKISPSLPTPHPPSPPSLR